jgi:heptosyltransferase-2
MQAPGRNVHLSEAYRGLVDSIGVSVTDRIPKLEPTAEDLAKGRNTITELGLREGGYVCLFPGARYGRAKRWNPSRFGLLGDTIIANLNREVVLLGGVEDDQACMAVEARMSKNALNLCSRLDFSALVGLLRLSYGVVANDSGGMHLSAALGVPVVGLFFSTDPSWTGPISVNARALYHRMECSPCFRRDCPKGVPCTSSITEEEVLSALEDLAEGRQ